MGMGSIIIGGSKGGAMSVWMKSWPLNSSPRRLRARGGQHFHATMIGYLSGMRN